MNQDAHITVTGQVTDIFAHRFVVQAAKGRILADIGPKGAAEAALKEGDHVELSGEMKPSELKVVTLTKNGGRLITVEHKKPEPGNHDAADSRPALNTVEASGFTVIGTPRRKPKHFEILGHDRTGGLSELHIELDGSLRKSKPVARDDPKWAAELEAMA